MDVANSCRSHAQILDPNVFKYFQVKSSGTKGYCHVVTISIGNNWVGKLSQKQQYVQMKADIKKAIPFRGKIKYLACFEKQQNGQLHAHLVTLGWSQASFIESFACYGRQNTADASFQDVRNIDGYCKYIDKEHLFPPIHNIHKKDFI